MVSRLLKNAFVSQIIESTHFLLMPPAKALRQVLIITSLTKGNYQFPQGRFLWKIIFSQQKGKGENIMELIKRPKLNLRKIQAC